jgi:hypothetical protein
MPIIFLLEKIRLKLMSRFHDRFVKAISWETKTIIYVRKMLENAVGKSKNIRNNLVTSDEY